MFCYKAKQPSYETGTMSISEERYMLIGNAENCITKNCSGKQKVCKDRKNDPDDNTGNVSKKVKFYYSPYCEICCQPTPNHKKKLSETKGMETEK
jgi:hypothetical protein